MNIKPIRTEDDNRAALAEISRLMARDPAMGTPSGDRLDVLVTLVQAFETAHYPVDAPDPIAAIRFRMDQQGLTPRDLEPMIGSRARVSEVLGGKRALSMAMVWRLHKALGIPAQSLIRPPRESAA
jgi:HTH-type transcriptional regulator/antitoxin HigA